MYKQLNIIWFVAVSLLLHAVFFTQYQMESLTAFKNSPNSLNVVISRKIIQLHFEKKTKSKAISSTTNKPNVNNNAIHDREEMVELSVDDSKSTSVGENDLDVKEQPLNNIIQPERQIQQQASEENLYIEEILLEIEKNKFYPALARRRNMQDIVGVSFTLLESGDVSNIELNGRYKILRHAAKSAILNALPFNAPPSEMHLPFNVKYSMAFKLE